MASVLVTGGTGTLGRHLVPQLIQRGHSVRVVSRRRRDIPGAEVIVGDVRSGIGLEAASRGVDTIVHAATSPVRRSRATEVDGMRWAMARADDVGAHLIYVSIVGVDSISLGYYRAKWEAEQLLARSSLSWTIQRATQLHELLDGLFLRGPIAARTRDLRFQPLAASDLARRLGDLVSRGPAGRHTDVGGPEILGMRELAAIRREVTGRRMLLVPMPALGPLKDLDAGRHLAPDDAVSGVTWREWLASQSRSLSR